MVRADLGRRRDRASRRPHRQPRRAGQRHAAHRPRRARSSRHRGARGQHDRAPTRSRRLRCRRDRRGRADRRQAGSGGGADARPDCACCRCPSPSRCATISCRRRSSSEDYPGLIEPGRRVETLAVGTVLIAYNWPKDSDHYQKIEKFVGAFFPRIAQAAGAAAPSEMARGQSCSDAAGLDAVRGRGGLAATSTANRPRAAREQFERFVRARGGPGGDRPTNASGCFGNFVQWSEARARR